MKDLKLSLVVAAIDRATAPLRKVGAGLKGLEERAEHLHKKLGGFKLAGILGGGLVIGAAVEAGRGIYELTNKTAELGESFLVGSKRAGISVEAYQQLSFAAKQLGVETDGLGTTFFRFETHLANAAAGNKEAVKALGLAGIDRPALRKLTADPVEALMRLSEGIKKIRNDSARAKVVSDLFGRGGKDILPVLMAGRAEIQKYVSQLVSSGAVMSKADAEAAEAFIQSKNKMGAALQGLQIQIGSKLFPILTQFIDKLHDMILRMKPGVIDAFSKSFGKLVDQLPAVVNGGLQLAKSVADAAPKVTRLVDKLGGLKTILRVLGGIMAVEFVSNVLSAVGTIGQFVLALRAIKIGAVVSTLVSLGAGFLGVIPGIIASTIAFLGLDLALGPILLVVGAIVAVVGALAFGAYELIKHWKPVSAFFSNLLNGVAKFFSDTWAKIENAMPTWLRALLKLNGMVFNLGVNGLRAPSAPAAAPAPRVPVITPAARSPGAVRPIYVPHGRAAAQGAAGAPPHGKVAVSVSLTQDGRVRDARVTAKGDNVTADLHRGLLAA